MRFQPSPRRRRAQGCQEQRFALQPATLGYLRLSPSPSFCFCSEPPGGLNFPRSWAGVREPECGLLLLSRPPLLSVKALSLAGLTGWHSKGNDNLLSWTLGEVYRPPPPSLLLVCSGKIAALPLPPALLAVLLSNNHSHLSTLLGSSPPSPVLGTGAAE